MRFGLEAKGLEEDAWLHDFVRTTIVFAIWHHDPQAEAVHVVVDRALYARGEGDWRCAVRAETANGPVCSEATGTDICEATCTSSNEAGPG